MVTRPAIFKWRQTEPGFILCAVRWYLRYSRSLREVEELLEERGLNVDHTTVWRWVQCYSPELEQRLPFEQMKAVHNYLEPVFATSISISRSSTQRISFSADMGREYT